MGGEPIFSSVYEALVFAYNFRWGQYPDTPMAKLLKRAGGQLGGGKGLSGLDGAAQAGMVQCEISRLSDDQRAAIELRFGSRPHECPVCTGPLRSSDWHMAAERLANAVSTVVEGDLRVRRALVRRHFGERAALSDLAEAIGMPKSTLGDQAAKVTAELRALEARAMRAAERALTECGMVDACKKTVDTG